SLYMPNWKAEIRKRLAPLNLSATKEADIVEELSQHLDQQYAELILSGADTTESLRAVLTSLDQNSFFTERLRWIEERVSSEPVVLGARRSNVMESFWQDLRYAARTLLKSPGFAAIAIITLAMGIGANTVIFSAVNALLIRPLPLPSMERLCFPIALREGFDPDLQGLVEYDTYRQRTHSFENLGIAIARSFNLIGRGDPEQIEGAAIDVNYFSTLGVSPTIGRNFSAEEDNPAGASVALISYGLWQQKFGGDPQISGKPMDLDGKSYQIIGVMPQGYDLPDKAKIWVPLQINIQSLPIDQ